MNRYFIALALIAYFFFPLELVSSPSGFERLFFGGTALAAAETAGEQSNGGSATLKGLFSADDKANDAPVYIKSDNLTLDSKTRIFTYSGEVEITKADLKITADTVIGRYSENNQLQTVVCQDNVVVTRGEDLRAIANKAIYRVNQATITLSEAPELMRGGNVLAADKITVFVNEDRSEAEGNVRVKVINAEEAGKKSNGGFFDSPLADSDEESEETSEEGQAAE